ncbi:MAG: protein jag [Actinomycetota bacterium]
MQDKKMEEALDSFVQSLEEEQKSGKLVEHNNWKQEQEKEDVSGLERVVEFIKKAVETICIGENIRVEVDQNSLKISVYGEDLAIAIGKNGKNMEALEYLVNLISARKKLVDKSILIDIKDYRKKKAEKIKRTALKLARKAVKEGRKIKLKPMCSFDRKIIHNTLSGIKDIRTKSKNEEPYRRIIIYPVRGEN